MPYVDAAARAWLNEGLSWPHRPRTEGELNYVLTLVIMDFLSRTKKKYSDFNAVVGVLECCKQEFYRRMVAPYEDKKIKENGDAFYIMPND